LNIEFTFSGKCLTKLNFYLKTPSGWRVDKLSTKSVIISKICSLALEITKY